MPNNVNNVSVGKPATSGVVFRADAGTELPQGANTSLAEAYKNMGYISDEGITKSTKRESDKIKAYGGDEIGRAHV